MMNVENTTVEREHERTVVVFMKQGIVVLTIVLAIVVLVRVCRGPSSRRLAACRVFSANLTLTAVVTLTIVALHDADLRVVARLKIGPPIDATIRRAASALAAEVIALLEVVQMTTLLLVIYNMMRDVGIQTVRGNGASCRRGLRLRSLIFIIALLDLVPTSWVVIKRFIVPYAVIRPKPIAVYHAATLVLAIIVVGIVLYRRCCRCESNRIRKPSAYEQQHSISRPPSVLSQIDDGAAAVSTPSPATIDSTPMSSGERARVFIYFALALVLQWLCCGLWALDLAPGRIEVSNDNLNWVKLQPWAKYLVHFDAWHSLLAPLLVLFPALLLLPGIGITSNAPREALTAV